MKREQFQTVKLINHCAVVPFMMSHLAHVKSIKYKYPYIWFLIDRNTPTYIKDDVKNKSNRTVGFELDSVSHFKCILQLFYLDSTGQWL